MNRKLYQK